MLGTTVALGLGSNLGNSIEYLRTALSRIRRLSNFRVQRVSSVFESDALTPENAPAEWNKRYLNAVVLVTIAGKPDPVAWLKSLKKIEAEIGRQNGEVWAPREIDIDILYWNLEPFSSDDLNIPHIRLRERPFALLPLLQVWPELHERLSMPEWAMPWRSERPFNTKISKMTWPRLVGILNVTPDSFSDGGRWQNQADIEQRLQVFLDHGVEIIDIGAESTRPQAPFVAPEEEFKRLQRGFEIVKSSPFKISLDCRRSEVAERILAKYNVDYLNDVSGFQSVSMQKLLKDSGRKAFVMHSLGVPPTKNVVIPEEQDPFSVLTEWWKSKCEQLQTAGISNENLIFDPGIGFGKTAEQSYYLLSRLEKFYDVKNEIMIGHSRKSFLNLVTSRPAAERDPETALVTQALNLAHVQYLRIHDPESQRAALLARNYLC